MVYATSTFLNPACSCRSFLSTASVILEIKTMRKTLLGMDSKVIPLQLLQLVKSPDFGILMMLPSDQLLGIITFFHILWNTGCKVSAARTGSILKSSAFRDRPFNLQGRVGYGFLFRSEFFFGQHER